MENTLYIGLSKQRALQQEMSTIANNIANVNTTAFKSQHLIQTEHRMGEREEFISRMVMDYGQFKNMEQGALKLTGNSYDMALSGPGYFAIQRPGEEGVFYTRAGNFALNGQNQLTTAAGHLVLDNANQPIVVPEQIREFVVDNNGQIATDLGALGQINLVEFPNDQLLEETGDGLFFANVEPEAAQNTQVLQGKLEQSNVQAVIEMTRMIDISRQYQSTQRILQTEHDRIRNAISKLGSLQGS